MLRDDSTIVLQRATISKTCLALLMLLAVVVGEPYFSVADLTTVSKVGVIGWFVRMHFALMITRCQYYFAWLLG